MNKPITTPPTGLLSAEEIQVAKVSIPLVDGHYPLYAESLAIALAQQAKTAAEKQVEINDLKAQLSYEKDKLRQLADNLNFWGDPIGKLKADHQAKITELFQEIDRSGYILFASPLYKYIQSLKSKYEVK